jgi:hypothetical protein
VEEITMKKTLTALVAAGTIAFAALATPTGASARDGGAVAAGIIGGLAAGAIIGSAVAAPPPPVYYAPAPVYVAPAPVYGPECRVRRERFWDGYGWRSRRVEICD